MKSRGFGAVELFFVAVLVILTALVGYYVYKTNQVQGPEVAELTVQLPDPSAIPEITSVADINGVISNLDEVDLNNGLEQLEALHSDLSL